MDQSRECLINLRNHLFTLPKGKISDVSTVEILLAEAWDELEGDYGGLTGHKICGRLEELKWDPPILSFTIERHGAMKFGSSRAELQDWGVDVVEGQAGYSSCRYREIYARARPLKTKPIAEEISKLILDRTETDKLKWRDNKTRVTVNIGKVILDDAARETVAARRKRFRRDLMEFLEPYGWEQIRPNNYRLSPKD